MDNYYAIIKCGDHAIEARLERNGEETVFYDGEVASSRMSVCGAVHEFSVKEGGKEVSYEVKVKPKGGVFEVITDCGMVLAPAVEVRRNGKKIHPPRRA